MRETILTRRNLGGDINGTRTVTVCGDINGTAMMILAMIHLGLNTIMDWEYINMSVMMDNPNLPENQGRDRMAHLTYLVAGVGSAAPLDPKRDAAQRVQKRDARGRTNAIKQEERRDRKEPLQIHDNITTIMYFYNPPN